jgi:hypothetical protein
MKKLLLVLLVIVSVGVKAQLIVSQQRTIIGSYSNIMNPAQAGDITSYVENGKIEYVWSYINVNALSNNNLPMRKSIKFIGDERLLSNLYNTIKTAIKEPVRLTLGDEQIEILAMKNLGVITYVVKTDNSLCGITSKQLDKLFGK